MKENIKRFFTRMRLHYYMRRTNAIIYLYKKGYFNATTALRYVAPCFEKEVKIFNELYNENYQPEFEV